MRLPIVLDSFEIFSLYKEISIDDDLLKETMMLKILNKTLNYCQITQKKEQISSFYPYIETVYSLVVSNYNNIVEITTE